MWRSGRSGLVMTNSRLEGTPAYCIKKWLLFVQYVKVAERAEKSSNSCILVLDGLRIV